jgi:hypothetical protein
MLIRHQASVPKTWRVGGGVGSGGDDDFCEISGSLVASMKLRVFWDVAPCSRVEVD